MPASGIAFGGVQVAFRGLLKATRYCIVAMFVADWLRLPPLLGSWALHGPTFVATPSMVIARFRPILQTAHDRRPRVVSDCLLFHRGAGAYLTVHWHLVFR